jgi:hypothetical protein
MGRVTFQASIGAEWLKGRWVFLALASVVLAVSVLSVVQGAATGSPSTPSSWLVSAINISTAVCATVGPVAGIVGGVYIFSMEGINRTWLSASATYGSAGELSGRKMLLGGLLGVVLWLACFAAVSIAGAFVPLGAVEHAALPVIVGRMLVGCAAFGYWYSWAGLSAVIVRNPAVAGALVALYAAVEKRVATSLGVSWIPLPTSSPISTYSVLEYPPGIWVSSPLMSLDLNGPAGIIAMGLYWAAAVGATGLVLAAHVGKSSE